VKQIVNVELLESSAGDLASLYVIRFEGEEINEYFKFLDKYEENKKYRWEFDVIERRIELIARFGAEDEHFRPEGKGLKALPSDKNALLRLYCYRIDAGVLILGNGGVKNRNSDPAKNKLKHFPELFRHANTIRAVGHHIERELQTGKVTRTANKLSAISPFTIKI
jgi:hypothetical protein